MEFIEHKYEYIPQLIDESFRSLHDKNLSIYEAINQLGKQVGQRLVVTHFISKHSRSPQNLYEDIEVQHSPLPIRSKLDEVLEARFLTPLKVSDNKEFLDKEKIERDLYALSR